MKLKHCKHCGVLGEFSAHRVVCRPCKRKYVREWYRSNKDTVRDYRRKYKKNKPIPARADALYRGAKGRAVKFGLTFELDVAWIRRRLERGICEATGLRFSDPTYRTGQRRRITPFTASVDRIDPRLGYTKENCRLVVFGWNALKGSGTDAEAFTICSAAIRYAAEQELIARGRATAQLQDFLPPKKKLILAT